MSLPVLSYEHHLSVAGSGDFLDKLKDFAVSRDWDLYTIIRDCSWGEIETGVYNWTNGDETYIQLKSTGYGFQELGYEFRIDPYSDDTDLIEWAMYDVGHDIVDTASLLHPIEQYASARNNYPSSGAVCHWFSFPAQTFPEMWIFGNVKYVLAVCRVTENTFICVSFGTLVLAEECWDRTDLGFWWPVQRYAHEYPDTYRWDAIADYKQHWQAPFTYAQGNATDCTANTADFDNDWRYAHLSGSGAETQMGDFGVYYNDVSASWATHGRFTQMQYACGYNDWSEKYVPIATRHFVRSGTLFRPVGVTPIAWIPWTGDLEPGEALYFGPEKFLAFPVHTSTSEWGFIVRTE